MHSGADSRHAVEDHRAGRPSARARAGVRHRKGTTFGNLVLTRNGIIVTGTDGTSPSAAGLQPSEAPTLPWTDVVRVHESDDGTLSIYRRGRPGERVAAPDPSVRWYSGTVPAASEAAALIVSMRNKALS
ncbi:hypothetical protein ACN27G_03225 [Plantactinospora sp. WMMB334]|uniref:hypothetical protein n=1 Tax=Plantactinospora sp. WMMB334 TaxID=3404119 RepID=UPI003B9480B8